MEGLYSPLSSAVASILSDVAWCSGTYEAPKEDLRVYYECPAEADPYAAKYIVFDHTNSAERLEDLVKQCQPASFGRGQQDVHDPSYRKAGELDTTKFSTTFNLSSSGILDALKTEMAIDHNLRAELYKLNVYDKGCFFKTHKDTPRSEDMIASLVIVLPTEHEGGSLVLRHGKKEFEFDSGKELSGSTSKVAYVAFFSDTDHEVKEVTSGHRVTLTYNLHVLKPNAPPVGIQHEEQDKELLDAMQAVLNNPDGTKYTRFAFGLQHQYTLWKDYSLTSNDFKFLKGSDAALLRICEQLGLTCRAYVLYKGEEYDEDEDDYKEVHRLAKNLIPDGQYYGDDEEEIWQYVQAKNIAKIEDLFWVTDPRCTNSIENHYVTYGNEPSADYAYGNIVMIAQRSRN